jgi:hypothetical protein
MSLFARRSPLGGSRAIETRSARAVRKRGLAPSLGPSLEPETLQSSEPTASEPSDHQQQQHAAKHGQKDVADPGTAHSFRGRLVTLRSSSGLRSGVGGNSPSRRSDSFAASSNQRYTRALKPRSQPLGELPSPDDPNHTAIPPTLVRFGRVTSPKGGVAGSGAW